MADASILSKVDGINKNLAALVKATANAFVGNAAQGQVTLSAAATTTVTNSVSQVGSFIILTPLNASAATLQGGATALYVVPANGSFKLKTANGSNAAGTEIIGFIIVNIA